MTAYSDGHVFVSRPVETTLPCPMRLKKFPFDTQTCDLTFGSWGSSGEVIDTQARLDGDGAPVAFAFSKDYHPNPEFDLVKVRSHSFDNKYACCKEPYPGGVNDSAFPNYHYHQSRERLSKMKRNALSTPRAGSTRRTRTTSGGRSSSTSRRSASRRRSAASGEGLPRDKLV